MLLGGCSSKLFTQCHQVAETICVTCLEHSYQHDTPYLALTLGVDDITSISVYYNVVNMVKKKQFVPLYVFVTPVCWQFSETVVCFR